jgi:hypothetical protein
LAAHFHDAGGGVVIYIISTRFAKKGSRTAKKDDERATARITILDRLTCVSLYKYGNLSFISV